VHEGSSCGDLFAVHSGWLIAFRQLRDGSRHIQNFWLPGEFCGAELAVFRNAPFSVMAITDCRVSAIAPEVLQDHIGGDVLNSLLCQTSIILRERMVSLGRRSAFLRVAYLLLELTLRQRKTESNHQLLPLSQLEVADSTGLTSVYVNRLFGTMRAKGQIEVSRRGIRLCEVEAFSREVEFNPRYLGGPFSARTLQPTPVPTLARP
jgi:CRP-like cAMP-binding protein